jgi:hypothetical protein
VTGGHRAVLQEVGCCRVSSRVSFSDLNPQLIFAELYGESLAQMEFNHGHSFGGFLGALQRREGFISPAGSGIPLSGVQSPGPHNSGDRPPGRRCHTGRPTGTSGHSCLGTNRWACDKHGRSGR